MEHVLTGTWEEIKTHDGELSGRQMKVVVYDGEQQSIPYDTSARLAAFDAWITAPQPQCPVLQDDGTVVIYGEAEDRG
jgi:hypothetical protein